MIKICQKCLSTWAGGTFCEDCQGPLVDPFDPRAEQLFPPSVWSYIRLQYGARRGMLVRVMAFLSAPVVFGLLARPTLLWPTPWNVIGFVAAALLGIGFGLLVYWLAGKAVRIWVLRKGQVQKKKLARALFRRIVRS